MRKIISFLLILLVFPIWKSTVSAASFTPRTTAPSTSSKYYFSDNIFYLTDKDLGMPNCTAYAWGRAYELLGKKPNLCTGNAGQWYSYNKSHGYYSYGSTPKLGAIACWDDYNSNTGHVAVVEKISGNNVTISESHYGGTFFDTRTITSNSSNYLTNKRFLGYIYIGNWDSEPAPLPSDAWLTASRTEIEVGQSVNFNFGISNVKHAGIGLDKDGKRYYTIEATGKSSASYTFNEAGIYSVVCECYNSDGKMGYSNWITITVYEKGKVPAPSDAWITSDKTTITIK